MAFIAAIATVPAARVQYRCGVCGRIAESESESVPQCAACSTPLCEQCNFFGLCQSHYERLAWDDQIRLQNLAATRQGNRQRIALLIAIPLLGGLVALSLGAYFGWSHSFGGTWMPFLLMGVIMDGILIVAVALRNFRENSVQSSIIREIAQKALTRPSNPRHSPAERLVDVTKYCPECGTPLPPKAHSA
jgi:hypothetical protein